MKSLLRDIRNRLYCKPWKLLNNIGLHQGSGAPIQFVVEKSDWAIGRLGENIRNEINSCDPGMVDITVKPYKVINSVVHFGSQYMWLNWGKYMSSKNKYITSFFHGKPEDGPSVERHIEEFLKSVSSLSKVVTGASLIEKRLLKWGVPREKLILIPIGVNTNLLRAATNKQKLKIRQKYKIDEKAILIGSFQKDGVGWGDGREPKLIKGPDLFVETLAILASKGLPVMALLTGPARGYVKDRLTEYAIPFFHIYTTTYEELVSLYHALDLYLVTSREEGGPMGLMESMASGIPVVSTKVGMAPDLIIDGVNGGITNDFSADEITEKVIEILNMSTVERNTLSLKARDAVLPCDWSSVAHKHWTQIYKPLIT